TVFVNSIILYYKVTNTKIANKDFRIMLVWDLIQEAIDNKSSSNRITQGQLKQKKASLKSSLKNKRITYVTKNFNLLLSQLSPGNHLVE
ncbi:6030_t:CDS:1, partial [Scutellospora calospora]